MIGTRLAYIATFKVGSPIPDDHPIFALTVNPISVQNNINALVKAKHLMVEIQLSQMSSPKLTSRFQLQTYKISDTIIGYRKQVFLVVYLIGDWN